MSNVTVVIPCFNAEKYIGEALESVLGQTVPPAEVIVVDDASTDRSVDIARSFGNTVRVLECDTNSGYCVVPKDIGLREARHSLVAFLDADDLWVPNKLELQLPKFDNPEVGLVYGRAMTFTTGRAPQGDPWPAELPVGNVVAEFYFRCYAPNSTVIARRSALLEAGAFDRSLDFCEDYDLWLRTAFRWKVDAVPEVLMWYRQHPHQASHRRAVQAQAHLALEAAHAEAMKRATGISEQERRQRTFERLFGQLCSEFYNERNLPVARMYAELIEQHYPDLAPSIKKTVRRLHARTYWPRFLFQLRDLVR